MTKSLIVKIFLALVFVFLSYLARADQLEISSYPGTTVIEQYQDAHVDYPLAISPINDEGEISPKIIAGRFEQKLFEGDESMSIGAVFGTLRSTLESEGFEQLFSCKNENCGGDLVQQLFARSAWKSKYAYVQYSGPVNNDYYYLAGRKKLNDRAVYLVYMVYKYGGNNLYISQDVLYEKAINTKPLTVKTKFSDIDDSGRVVLEGVYFKTNSAELEASSDSALVEIAEYLSTTSDQQFYIVGHTDSQGDFDYNMALSAKRAGAVRNALIEKYGVSADRLTSHGVGALVPKQSNSSDKGRQQNRRVELVQASQ